MPKWIADRRIYLNHAGVVCAGDDPDADRLLVGEGEGLAWDEAVRLGLVPPRPDTTGKALAAPPRTKARSAPPEVKADG